MAGVVLLAGALFFFARDANRSMVALNPVEPFDATLERQGGPAREPRTGRAPLSETAAGADHFDQEVAARVRVRTRLGLPLGGLEWRASGEAAWVAVEDAGLEAELALPESGLEVRCRAHLVATSHGDDVVLEPIASLLLRSEFDDAFTRGVREWAAMDAFGAGDPYRREVEASILHGPVEAGFAAAVDAPRLRRVRGEQALYRARFTFRSAVSMQLDWMPVAGQHVVEPMDDALFARAPNLDLRVVPRRTWPGPEPKVLDYSLSCVALGKPRVEERPWGRMSFAQRALWNSERRREFALATFERLPLGHEYELFVSSVDGDHIGRRRFRFDGSEVAVDLYPGLRLRGRLDLGGVSVREPVRLEAFVQMGDGEGRDYLWQDRTRLELASELTFDFAAIRRELGEGAADFPPPRSGRVRLEVVGFEPWEEHMAWPTDRSLLDLGTIVLEPRVPDLALPRNALREGAHWVAILTPSLDDWNVVGSTSVDASDWLRLAHHHGESFDAADHSHILALTGGPGFDDGVGFERDRDSWRELPSSDYVVRVELGPALAPGDRLRLSWAWRDCVVLRGTYDGADFEDGRYVELRFRAPTEGVLLFAVLTNSVEDATRKETVDLVSGLQAVRVF